MSDENFKALFEECQLARDEAGFLGSVPDCIRCLDAEIAKLREENERLREALHELDEYLRYNTVVSEETEPERIFSKAFGSKASLAKEPTP